MIGNSSQRWVLIPPSQKPIAESLSSQYFASQSYSEWSCCVTGRGSISGSWKTTVMIGPPLLSLIAPSHISVPAFPLCDLKSRSSCSLQASKSCTFWPHAQSSSGCEALRKSASIAATRIMAVKTQQATLLLPKVPPFATNCLNVVLLRR